MTATVKCADQRYLLQVKIILRLQQVKLLLLVFGRAHQQIVEHVVVPVGHRAPIQSNRSQAGFISTFM